MSSIIYKLLWFLLYFFVETIETVYNWCTLLIHKCHFFLIESHQLNTVEHELKLIYKTKDILKKIPSHIIVILLNNDKPNYKKITKLIRWCYAAGVNYISFYDYEGEYASVC